MNTKELFQMAAIFTAGILISLIAVYLIGYTIAIAMPTGFLAFFGSLSLFLWDLLIVNFLGVGIIAFMSAFVIFRTIKQPRMLHGILAILGILCGAYIVVPLLYDIPLYLPINRSWWGYGFEICVLLAFITAWFLAKRRA